MTRVRVVWWFVLLFLLGLPVWFWSTSLERGSLPHTQISLLRPCNASDPRALPSKTHWVCRWTLLFPPASTSTLFSASLFIRAFNQSWENVLATRKFPISHVSFLQGTATACPTSSSSSSSASSSSSSMRYSVLIKENPNKPATANNTRVLSFPTDPSSRCFTLEVDPEQPSLAISALTNLLLELSDLSPPDVAPLRLTPFFDHDDDDDREHGVPLHRPLNHHRSDVDGEKSGVGKEYASLNSLAARSPAAKITTHYRISFTILIEEEEEASEEDEEKKERKKGKEKEGEGRTETPDKNRANNAMKQSHQTLLLANALFSAFTQRVAPFLPSLERLATFSWDFEVRQRSHVFKRPPERKTVDLFSSLNSLNSSSVNAFVVPLTSLPQYLNAHEWNLRVVDTTSPCLHFVLLLPSVNHSPLEISGSPGNSFVVPQWGGVVVVRDGTGRRDGRSIEERRDEEEEEGGGEEEGGEEGEGGIEGKGAGKGKGKGGKGEKTKGQEGQENSFQNSVFDPEEVASEFLSQFRRLLGLVPSIPVDTKSMEKRNSSSSISPLSKNDDAAAAAAAFTAWEIDSLVRRSAFFLYFTTLNTLSSLSKLSTELAGIPIPYHLGKKCERAIANLELVQARLRFSDFDGANAAARRASVDAEAAFFDQDMLAMLYFPDEHKLAVYALPFIPIAMQLISSLLSLGRRRFRRWLKSRS